VRRRGWRVVIVGIAVVGMAAASTAVARAGGTKKLEATDVGVTATEIHIAVIADVNNPVVPGLFQGSVNGVKAFGTYINKHGGLAGRKVVVDFLDSKLSADAARDAVIKACEADFALVGTSALFLNNLDPLIGCTDKAGAATGLPDVTAIQTSFAHQCSPVSYSFGGTIMDCTTKDQHPQTYRAVVGPVRYLKKTLKLTKGSWILGNDIKGTLDATLPLAAGERSVGMKGDNFPVSGIAPQTTFTPYVQSLQRDGVEYVENYSAATSLALAQKEARIQGITVKAWNCTTACYSDAYLKEAGDVAEGTYVWTPEVPREETSANKGVATMVKAIGKDKIDGFAELSWEAALLFRDAVNALVKAKGENALTRANLLETLSSIHDFTADGVRGPTDVGTHTISSCFALIQVKNGKFVRVHPQKKGTLDCSKSNIARVKYDNQT
jgi:hypothetical protein